MHLSKEISPAADVHSITRPQVVHVFSIVQPTKLNQPTLIVPAWFKGDLRSLNLQPFNRADWTIPPVGTPPTSLMGIVEQLSLVKVEFTTVTRAALGCNCSIRLKLQFSMRTSLAPAVHA